MDRVTVAQQHFDRIKHFYEHGGGFGYVAASYHFEKLSDCLTQSPTDSDYVNGLHILASRFMAAMKRRADRDAAIPRSPASLTPPV